MKKRKNQMLNSQENVMKIDKPKIETLYLRIPLDLKKDLIDRARKEGVTLNKLMIYELRSLSKKPRANSSK